MEGMMRPDCKPSPHPSSIATHVGFMRRRLDHLPQAAVPLVIALALGAAFLLAAVAPAFAAPVEVPDPKVWVKLSPEEQAARRAEIQQRLQAATPEERQSFRARLRERLESLSPEERQAIAGQTRERWQQMPPEERERLARERREQLRAMSPEERRQLLQQRRQMLEKLSPEERAALREKLH
jgi:hypothetical protein